MSDRNAYEDFMGHLGYREGRARKVTSNLVNRRALDSGETVPERYREDLSMYADPAQGFAGKAAPREAEVAAGARDPSTPDPIQLRMPNAAENEPRAFGMGEKIGGLGGLGGFTMPKMSDGVKGGIGDTLQAVGMSLISSPRNHALRDAGSNFVGLRDRRDAKDAAEGQRAVMQDALKKIGFSDEDAALYADNPKAAELVRSAEREKREEVKSSAARERAYAYLEAKHPDVAAMVASGLPLEDGWKMAAEARKSGGRADISQNPVYGTDAGGNPVIMQLGDDGRAYRTELPDGVAVATGTDKIDAGTHWVIQDKRTGQMIGTVPKENYQEAADTARGSAAGKAEGENAAAAPATVQMASDIDTQIQSLKNDPALPNVLGPFDSRTPIFREESAGVQAKIDQLKGGAFLQGRQMLKGGGAISDTESNKAEAAFARLNQAQSVEDFNAALDEFNAAVQAGARIIAGARDGETSPATGASVDELLTKYGG